MPVIQAAEPQPPVSLVLRETAAFFGFSPAELTGPNRDRDVMRARYIGMYLCRQLTQQGIHSICGEFGARDHTTVLYAERKVGRLVAERGEVLGQINELTLRIRRAAGG